ncbi:fimbrial protein [uncultured Bacteroides sp.]|uniref:fimbrial protein n=1 Tax=uncultured Bacteroides sp. TaxID=162156 RepID=UPI002601243B|nr:fimbrial protein [uncultured Bacteroides sp.]
MKQLIHLSKKTVILLFTLAVGALAACQDDEICSSQADGVEGVPTLLTLSVDLNEMKGMSRAPMTDENADRVNTLWVGIYNVATGKCTYNRLFQRDELTAPGNHAAALLPKIETKSGKSYIVAVANAADNYGITDNAELKAEAGLPDTRGGSLQTLLANADTWEKYKSISFMLTDPSNIDFSGSNNLAMSGSYHNSNAVDNHPSAWYDDEGNPDAVYIAANTTTLPGYIHLRRMISYVKFNISAVPNILIEPVSWKVYNNPIIAYLQERNENAADVSEYFGDRVGYETNHGESNLSYDFVAGTANQHSFDFYQFENKQTAIGYQDLGGGDYIGINPASFSPYADREREWKADADGTNTSIYKSLSASDADGEVDTKNYATYVTFRFKVTYWVNPNGQIGTEKPVDPATPNATRREGYANYTVHLGYIEGATNADKARDFNCRRNMKYTYNVTVEGLNSIIVEAFNDGENQPGAEGDVTDVQNTGRVELDAHYSTFNIQLSYSERNNLQWMIEAPYNNVSYSYYAADYRPGGTHAGVSLEDNQFYNWIRFKPTTAADVLRRYNDGDGEEAWTLE